MSKTAELAKKYYKEGKWSIEYLEILVQRGKLTKAEFTEITGKDYGA